MTNNLSLDLTVIIPFKNRVEMTLDSLRSLLSYCTPVREVLLVSNNSDQVELDKIKDFAKDHANVNVLEYNHPFNYQKINNWAVSHAKGKFILFLNNDTELRKNSIGLVERMVKRADNDSVGIVGCLLLFGDEKTIQHAGVYLMPGGLAEHLYVAKNYRTLASKNTALPYSILDSRPMTAVTGAVQVVSRKKFLDVGGFDEKFTICGGDVDLCIRLNNAGFQTWYEAGGYIIHKESQSRKFTPIPHEDFNLSYLSYMKAYDLQHGDPFSPNIVGAKI